MAELESSKLFEVFDAATRCRLEQEMDFYPTFINQSNLEEHKEQLHDVEVAFSTWGIAKFTEAELQQYLPNLKIVLYGAGSVQHFARPFLARNVIVVSSWAANAVPVAEFTVATIVLANKGFFNNARQYKQNGHKQAAAVKGRYKGNYGATVGLLGAGMIGQLVIGMLSNYNLSIKVFDPFLSDEKAAELGVMKSGLIDIFSTCDTISNHLANLPETQGILHKEHFSRMKPYATFVNTGRGAQVVEEDLIQALKDEPGRYALLDVTFPEPVVEGSELMTLDNVILTSHIAGSMNAEVARLGQYAAEEFERYRNGESLRYRVTLDMLATMA
ncbi:hydroxyacid dehydrogenase [Paenibacillus cymbidii]|uniref:hydroxyacid dehydrogenase n=1 Tax=Paenibacillus cymbidii TaxID=1639034 RepID=UPI0014368889|nr:hydroxyacid dehydrogenase [Paenibacillus cymbidii]